MAIAGCSGGGFFSASMVYFSNSNFFINEETSDKEQGE